MKVHSVKSNLVRLLLDDDGRRRRRFSKPYQRQITAFLDVPEFKGASYQKRYDILCQGLFKKVSIPLPRLSLRNVRRKTAALITSYLS